jgi:hypothetical protein
MSISLDSIDLRAKLPDLPGKLAVIETSAPSLKERQRALDLMADTLQLGKRRAVDLPHGIAYVSRRGEVEYFQASGAVWSRDAEAEQKHDNELRKWPKLVKQGGDKDARFALPKGTSRVLLGQAKEMIGAADLGDKAMDGGRIVLDQVAQLSEKGEIIQSGAGAATVIFGFAMEGLPVFGAGAKSTFTFEPVEDKPKIVGSLHVWRSPAKSREIKMPSVEEALSVGLLEDSELRRYAEKGAKITVSRLALGYMALPAMVQQRYLFPVLDVQGQVSLPDDKLGYFQFARYHHAAPAASYKKADIYAPYLAKRN